MDFKSPGVPMLNSPTLGTAAGDAFYARVVRRVGAWHDSPIVLDKILAEMRERPDFYQEMMRQEIRCKLLNPAEMFTNHKL
jgi:hypothetical protein